MNTDKTKTATTIFIESLRMLLSFACFGLSAGVKIFSLSIRFFTILFRGWPPQHLSTNDGFQVNLVGLPDKSPSIARVKKQPSVLAQMFEQGSQFPKAEVAEISHTNPLA